MKRLSWPPETAVTGPGKAFGWSQPDSNICLDFHGDPIRARLAVFSDGNHHMALQECLQRFLARNEAVRDVFYVTTPPAVLIDAMRHGGVNIGNLHVSVVPQVCISPPAVLDQIVAQGRMATHQPFMRSRGNVLLVLRNNPKGIRGVRDLARSDVRLFLSNPQTEKASNQVYVESLNALARNSGVALDFLGAAPGTAGAARVCFGECIHHREAPQALADERADAAIVYYHLALRYTRIFPDMFEIVPLGGQVHNPQPLPGNQISVFHIGLVGRGGDWGAQLHEFLMGAEATGIYQRHGLARPGD
ncbi:MAG: molybdate ABC transporter substrate-binding protein [Acidiferrobacterales bacterium]